MSGNSFGNLFKITTWGESHGPAIGVVIDGCPAGLKLTEKDIQKELDRRRPGQSTLTTPRKESDKVEILSGIFEGMTTGTPISLMVKNKNQKGRDYTELKEKFRPSHADYTYEMKYGIRDYLGGGRASARETIGRVAAGAIAKKILKEVKITATIKQIHKATTQKEMIQAILEAKKSGDSVGGIIECVIKNVPVGLGSPVFEKLDARLAQAMLSIPAVKGFEIGSGFGAIELMGSEHNDPIQKKKGKVVTLSNNAGGIVGGISNGMDIVFRIAFKPTATIFKKQSTITKTGKNTTLEMKGRHDPCVLPRAIPIVEAMAALTLADELLIQKAVK
ncbi:chorismate synthase [Candidatus Pacearchaeota archaeon]|nr:chorismate synthase [Candidatus Pacearchaeota archaeon]